MEELANNIFKNQGFFGLFISAILVFCGLLIWMLLRHFMIKDNKKDAQIIQMGREFAASLDANTKALNSISQTEMQLVSVTEKFQQWLFSAKEQNEKEHREILTFIQENSHAGNA